MQIEVSLCGWLPDRAVCSVSLFLTMSQCIAAGHQTADVHYLMTLFFPPFSALALSQPAPPLMRLELRA